ncbi:MAG: hypothetical protein Q8T09_23905 [Candidatus Melainabacteria bacterium]|nr:hypothetical protein [Candidatus Melainabacteria bacterium]
MFIKATSVALLLLTLAALSFSDAEARGSGRMGGMRMGGMRMGGMRMGGGLSGLGMGASGRGAFGGQIRLGRGRGGRRGGYNRAANIGPTVEQQQASYFQQRSAQNPYSSVPQRVNVSDYVRVYR